MGGNSGSGSDDEWREQRGREGEAAIEPEISSDEISASPLALLPASLPLPTPRHHSVL